MTPPRTGGPWAPFCSHPYLWIAGLCLAVYARTISFGFTYLDDHVLILQRQDLLRQWAYFFQAFKEDAFSSPSGRFYYRPLLAVSYLIDTQIAGVSPAFYHCTNVLLHLFSSCLVYRVWTRLGLKAAPALFLASLFAVHPALTQTVALLNCRNESLFAVFLLLSFLSFVDFVDTRAASRFLMHIAFFSCALLTKETAVVLPVICLFYLWRVRRQSLFNAWHCSWVPILGFWWLIRSRVLDNPQATDAAAIPGAILRKSPFILAYLGRFFLPIHLSVYPYMDDAILWIGIVTAILLAVAIGVSKKQKSNLISLGVFWFVVFLIPSLAKPDEPFSTMDMLENRAYVPAMGLGFILGSLDLGNYFRWAEGLRAWLGASLLLFWSCLTVVHSGHFKDRLSFWENAAAAPAHSAFVLNNLGAMYYLDQRFEDAERQWRKAVELNDKEKRAHGNLGLACMRRGAWEEAQREMEAEIALNPLYDIAHFNLGLLFYQQGKYADAEILWKKTLDLNPNYADAYYNLIVLSRQRNDANQAARYLDILRQRGIPIPPQLAR